MIPALIDAPSNRSPFSSVGIVPYAMIGRIQLAAPTADVKM